MTLEVPGQPLIGFQKNFDDSRFLVQAETIDTEQLLAASKLVSAPSLIDGVFALSMRTVNSEPFAVSIALPEPLPPRAGLWLYEEQERRWKSVPSTLATAEDGGSKVSLQLHDNGELDSDPRLGRISLKAGFATPQQGSSNYSLPHCFIATAVYGHDAGQLALLRSFRDKVLLKSALGEAFVGSYYRHSPPMADWLRENPAVKPVVRALLLPVVAAAWVLMAPPAVLVLLLIALMVGVFAYKYGAQQRRRAVSL